jgi:hypothetical protein
MLYYGDNCFNLIISKVNPVCELRDLYTDIYRIKMGHPRRREKAWPKKKLEAGAGQ